LKRTKQGKNKIRSAKAPEIIMMLFFHA